MEQSETMQFVTLCGIEVKEDNTIKGLIATTHPDKVGDILSVNTLKQITNSINDKTKTGSEAGSYRGISLYHDWVKQNNPSLDEAGFLKSAKLIQLKDGHYGVEVEAVINEFYKGSITPEEISYRIKNDSIGGFSIEYIRDKSKTKQVSYNDKTYNFIDGIELFGGVAFARSRLIANPSAIIYKELHEQVYGGNIMSEEIEQKEDIIINDSNSDNIEKKEEIKETVEVIETKETVEKIEEKESVKSDILKERVLDIKEILESKEFQETLNNALEVKTKTFIPKREEKMNIEIKELNEAIKSGSYFEIKEKASKYIASNNYDFHQGVPLINTLEVKCDGNKLKIVGQIEVKDTLNTGSNPSAYTQRPAELADVYRAGLIDTFNNQTNTFGSLRKVDNVEGGDYYGWTISTDSDYDNSVNVDDPTVVKKNAGKLKLRTQIKAYRKGVSVTDYMLYHSRAGIGNLFMIEIEKRMKDIMKGINQELFTAQADGTTKILGYPAVANAAAHTTLFGTVRSATNRLAPDTATDTYTNVSGNLTVANIRLAVRKVKEEGAMKSDLRIRTSLKQVDNMMDLEDGKISYTPADGTLGFRNGVMSWDGIVVLEDADCDDGELFVTDDASDYIVVSKAPAVTGLAKVSAAEEAYVETYLAHVYEQPRRIYMLDGLTGA